MRKFPFFILVFAPFWLFAQSTYVPLQESYYHLVDRYEVKSGLIFPQIFTAVKPYRRSDIVDFADSVNRLGYFVSPADKFNLEYLQNDNWEWARPETNDSRNPVLTYFYRKKSDLFHVDDQPDFDLHVNPVLYVGAGRDTEVDDLLFTNTRGVEVRGMIDNRVGFYSFISENQVLVPGYIQDFVSASAVIPHEGFWKPFKDGKGYDFFQARGYITFEATRHIGVQFGHDRFFIGNGFRSLIFSDFAPPAWFIRGNVNVWKLNYSFSTHQMIADRTGGERYPNKFIALHHLSVNLGKKLNLGIFESVVFSPDDSTGANSFRIDYLNPVIFYRAIEQQNGSSDNVLLGFDFKWNALKGVQVYGQFVLDEFVIDNIRAGNGWWANKFGIQAGAKYVDALGIANLDLQVETNIVRPYTYSHYTLYGSYSGYRQSLAHPLGANFKEVAGIVRYQPLPRLNLVGKLVLMQTGRDSTGYNFGGDMLKLNSTRNNGKPDTDVGNTIGQGFSNDIVFGSLVASWQFKHNLFLDVNVTVRQSTSDLAFYNTNSTITSLALRWNIPQRLYEF